MMKFLAAGAAGVLVASLMAPHVFTEFSPVREKIVRGVLPATSNDLHIPIPAKPSLDALRAPFAAISRVRNDSGGALTVRLVLDGAEVCSTQVAAGASDRFDCAVIGSWAPGRDHTAVFSGSSSQYAVEYFELATHYGAMTPGPRDLIFGPEGFTGSRPPAFWHFLLIALLGGASALSVRHRRLVRPLRIAHLAVVSIAGAVLLVVLLAGVFTAYDVLIQDVFLEKLLLITALPVLVFWAHALVTMLRWPRVWPVFLTAAAGVIVGAVFLSYASHLIASRYQNNPSGLVLISHMFFDRNPMVNGREDIRESLLLIKEGGGYDGQFFYFMAFDPFLRTFRDEPKRYNDYIDAPPYRYGRIGYSVLIKLFSLDRPLRYPITMVALIIGSLAVCGLLLSLIAQHYGFSPWYGMLIAFVPGFWQSVEGSLPEPVAVAFFLGAYLCLLREKWWACGALLGMSMLVRETGGALVLAVPAGLFLARKPREAIVVAALAFVPVVAWKVFVASVFWSALGGDAVLHTPNNAGLPFAGVVEMWQRIGRGEYFDGLWELTRAGVIFPFITTAAAVLAAIVAIRRPSALAAAGVFYGLLTITYNYDGVWLHVGNAQRLTIDLFVALALILLHASRQGRILPRTFAVFWAVTGCYMFFGCLEASAMRESVFGWLPGL